jgi:hypothetical protein
MDSVIILSIKWTVRDTLVKNTRLIVGQLSDDLVNMTRLQCISPRLTALSIIKDEPYLDIVTRISGLLGRTPIAPSFKHVEIDIEGDQRKLTFAVWAWPVVRRILCSTQHVQIKWPGLTRELLLGDDSDPRMLEYTGGPPLTSEKSLILNTMSTSEGSDDEDVEATPLVDKNLLTKPPTTET